MVIGSGRRGGLTRALRAVAVLLAVAAPPHAAAQGVLSALETDADQIARAARPSVVTIVATRPAEPGGAASRQRVRTRVGSGVAVESDLVITTASVIHGANRISIRTTNGLRSDAVVVGSDPISNIALIRVTEVRLPRLAFASRRPAREGDWVMTIGTSHSRTQIVQSVGTVAYRHASPRLPLLQLTNTVYPGYSGGAVVNVHGELIGVVIGEVGAADAGDAGSDLRRFGSFVLPSETVEPVFRSLRDLGHVPHGYLGVSTSAASVESESEPGTRIPVGALVESVQPGGPAQAVGLRRGDMIVGFERERVEFPEQLARWVAMSAPGSSVELVWVRDDDRYVGRAVLGESPDSTPPWALLGRQPAPAPTGDPRIADLERQIQRLSRELDRLKAGGTATP